MNRTLCILIWTVVTYYTSLNMEQLELGAMTQVYGLVVGTLLAAFAVAAFVAKERELVKLGLFASLGLLVVAGLDASQGYLNFYYNVDKYVVIHKSLLLLLVGTVGAIRCILQYEQSLRLQEKAQSLKEMFKEILAEIS